MSKCGSSVNCYLLDKTSLLRCVQCHFVDDRVISSGSNNYCTVCVGCLKCDPDFLEGLSNDLKVKPTFVEIW